MALLIYKHVTLSFSISSASLFIHTLRHAVLDIAEIYNTNINVYVINFVFRLCIPVLGKPVAEHSSVSFFQVWSVLLFQKLLDLWTFPPNGYDSLVMLWHLQQLTKHTAYNFNIDDTKYIFSRITADLKDIVIKKPPSLQQQK